MQLGKLTLYARRLAATAVLAVAVAPATAHAGTYDVYGCKDPATGQQLGPDTPSGWSFLDSNPGENNYDLHQTCSSPLGGIGISPFNSPNPAATMNATNSNPRFAEATFSAPANTVIRGYSIYRSMAVNGQRTLALYFREPSVSTFCHGNFQDCHYGDPNSALSPGNRVQRTFTDGGASYVQFTMLCDGGSCNKDRSTASVRIFSSQMRLEENDKPTFSSPPSGSLLESGVVSGTRTLDFVAADVGAGVRRLSVTSSAKPDTPLASKIVDSGNGRCSAAKFVYVVPCPQSIDDSLEVDTLQFPDGAQTITITIEDAAGNTKSVTRPITVKNAPASSQAPSVAAGGTIKAGDELTCNPGTFTPPPERIEYAWLIGGVVNEAATASKYVVRAGDVGKPIVCRVTAVRGGGSTVVESPPVGGPSQNGPTTSSDAPNTTTTTTTTTTSSSTTSDTTNIASNPANANGSGGLVTTARFSAASKKTRRIRYGQKATLTGQIVDADGRPIRGASVDVFSTVATKGAVRRRVGTVVTDGDGVYRWVAPVGVSRRIRFAYRAITGAADYRAQVDIALQVRAKLALRARSRHVRSFGTMHLRGRLYGSGLPSRGAIIEIQYRDGTRWETTKVRRTKKGRFGFDYRFKRTSHGTFTFRARMRGQTGIPLTGSVSKPVRVKVG